MLKDKKISGQAFVEFALISMVLLFMVFAAFEGSRYTSLKLRMSSTTREAARLFVADEIEPAIYATNSTEYTSNVDTLTATISNNVYNPIKSMILPGDLQNKGKVIISILRRFDNPTGTTPRSVTTASTNDDRILVEYRFVYPSTNSFTNWNSQVGYVSGYTNVYTNILPVSALSIDERTVAVEIYHKTDFIAPQGVLNLWSSFEYVYDMAVF